MIMAMAAICAPSLAQDGIVWSVSAPPEATGQLIDQGPAQVMDNANGQLPAERTFLANHGMGQGSLWIVDSTGTQKRTTLDIPLNRFAREEIIPHETGQLVLFERYPDGTIKQFYPGFVNRGRSYRMWFIADTPGTHEVYFRVNQRESNHIWFNVGGGSPGGGGGSGTGTGGGGGINPGSGCSVWTDKSSYGLGETVTIYYRSNWGTTAELKVYRPDGTVSARYGPRWMQGTLSQMGMASYPLGRRTVVLQTNSGCRSVCYFDVMNMGIYFGSNQDGNYSNEGNAAQMTENGGAIAPAEMPSGEIAPFGGSSGGIAPIEGSSGGMAPGEVTWFE
ncbi:MAG: hypothetical protein GKC10_09705 [Methanosarcinales archaeon]|nr:hypothetical protein [Methanosarcinales archaeon]